MNVFVAAAAAVFAYFFREFTIFLRINSALNPRFCCQSRLIADSPPATYNAAFSSLQLDFARLGAKTVRGVVEGAQKLRSFIRFERGTTPHLCPPPMVLTAAKRDDVGLALAGTRVSVCAGIITAVSPHR